MIKKLKLKFGSSQAKPPLDNDLTPITVFVGPNNSGKSKVLIEIEKFCKEGVLNTTNVILTGLEFNNLSDPETEISNRIIFIFCKALPRNCFLCPRS
jgi:predicted ATPase